MDLLTRIIQQEEERTGIKKYYLSELLLSKIDFEQSRQVEVGKSDILIIRDICINIDYALVGGLATTKGSPYLLMRSDGKTVAVRDWQMNNAVFDKVASKAVYQYRNQLLHIHKGSMKLELITAASETVYSAYAIGVVIHDVSYLLEP